MMKRLLLSAGTAFLLLAGSLRAQTVTLDGITYTIHTDGQTASVSGYEGSPVDIVIPATVAYDGADYPVTSIGSSAFEYCRSLENITLPEGLQTIGESAFSYCVALAYVTFPEGLQYIGGWAFYDCPLADVYCHAAVPPSIETDTFDERTYAEAMLHMPSDALGDYQVAEGWKLFQHILGDLPSTAIGSVAADAPIARYADGIVTTTAPADITVYAQSGAQVRHAAHCTSLSLAGLPGGIYIIGIEQGGQRQVLKVAR